MALKVKKAAVLGAGVMGTQIAAQLASAGIDTILLDLKAKEAPKDPKAKKLLGNRWQNAPALMSVEQLKKMKPSPIYSQEVLKGIHCGNFDDDFHLLEDVDFVLEAVIERLDIKQSIHKRVMETVKDSAIVATNTSGIPLKDIAQSLPESYGQRFLGVHFFNPPRYMSLVEVIPCAQTQASIATDVTEWLQNQLGKTCVRAKDTVNFIANRIGTFNFQISLKAMSAADLNFETVDLLTGKLMGRPASATFRTLDVVGLDTYRLVISNVVEKAPEDPWVKEFESKPWIDELIEKGHLGAKSGGKGAYLKSKDEKGKRKIQVYRPAKSAYEDQSPADISWLKAAKKKTNLVDRLSFILEQDDPAATFVWESLRDTMLYSAELLDTIADGHVERIDVAMKAGFNWTLGPFEMWQGLGVEKIKERMKADGCKLPSWVESQGVQFYDAQPGSEEWELNGYTEAFSGKDLEKVSEKVWQLPIPKSESPEHAVLSNASASLVDVGDGIAALVFHSKMNTLDSHSIEMISAGVERASQDFEGLIVGNHGENFCAGANIFEIVQAAKSGQFSKIEAMIADFQIAMMALKTATIPTVTCPHGLTLGGGCETALHGSHVLAAAETYTGLVEVGVGLLPAGGGTKELALRAHKAVAATENGDPFPFIARAFMNIGMGKVSSSGHEAVEMGLFAADKTTLSISRDQQLYRAKKLALTLSESGFVRTRPETRVKVVGRSGVQTIRMMLLNMQEGLQISPYDAHLGEVIATVLCGGDVDAGSVVDEQWFLDLERQAFIELCEQKKTQERIEHMLTTGKPLRN